MHPTSIPFPSSQDKENATIMKGGRRARRDALIAVTNSSGRPSLQHVAPNSSSVSQSTSPVITKPTNTARTQERCLTPTNQDGHPSSAPQSPPRITILKNPARARPLPSIQSVLSSSAPHSPPRITILTNPARARPLPSNLSTPSEPAPRSPPRITSLRLNNPAEARPIPSIQTVLSSSAPQSPPRITILKNPARARPLQSIQSVPSPSAPESPPRITILNNPARARPLLPNESTPSSSSAPQSAPRITILTNPARVRPSSSPQSSERIPNVSAAAAAALKRAPASAPFPTESVPAGVHPTLAAARAALKKVQPKPIPIPTSLRIVVHEPVSWDERTDVHLPPTGHHELLGVPAVDVQGKLQEREFARHYPKEYAADETLLWHRSMLRNGSNLSS
ncbi:hypothetical protein BC827DRAFT_1158723 [Russula dissimulans]|nr:hypothetical protein BC827DRAFT_1158723 [Russula dissimulans]